MAAASKKKSAPKKKAAAEASGSPCQQYEKNGTCSHGDKCKRAHHHNTPSSPNSQKSRQIHEEGAPIEPIDAFFAEYPTFDFQRNAPFWDQFRRLGRHMSWGGRQNERKREDAKERFKTALVEQFNYAYGTDDRSLEAWQRLCRILGVGEPTTLKEARTLVQRTHVNLCDLTEHPVTGEDVKIFSSVHALRAYTINTRRFFPKEDAKAGGLLKKLLREIKNVSLSKQQQQKLLLDYNRQQPDQNTTTTAISKNNDNNNTNTNTSTSTNKKKEKKKKKQKKTIKRKDSGVHLDDSSSPSGAEHDRSQVEKPLQTKMIATPFVLHIRAGSFH